MFARLRKLFSKQRPDDPLAEFVSRSSYTVVSIVLNAKRLRGDAKLLFEKGSYPTAASVAVLSLEESGKACLIQWAELKFLTRVDTLKLLQRHFDKQRILAPYMVARAMKKFAPIIKDRAVTDLDYSRLADPGFAEHILDQCYTDIWTSLEMTAEGGAFDHIKEVGLYFDVNLFLQANLSHIPVSSVEAKNMIRCADLGIEAATADEIMQKAMFVFYKTEMEKLPNRAKRDEFAMTLRRAWARGLKEPPTAFGDQKE